jgi:hypothetical protein
MVKPLPNFRGNEGDPSRLATLPRRANPKQLRDVRFWHKADMLIDLSNVCFWG